MPFKKVGPNKYVSPSGKKFTESQVKLYYSLGGTFRKDDQAKSARSTKAGRRGTNK